MGKFMPRPVVSTVRQEGCLSVLLPYGRYGMTGKIRAEFVCFLACRRARMGKIRDAEACRDFVCRAEARYGATCSVLSVFLHAGVSEWTRYEAREPERLAQRCRLPIIIRLPTCSCRHKRVIPGRSHTRTAPNLRTGRHWPRLPAFRHGAKESWKPNPCGLLPAAGPSCR